MSEAKWATWNPVTGCVKISGGCAECYAERISHKYGTTSLPWNAANASVNVVLHPDRMDAPLHWRMPREVFAGSMTDLFGEVVPEDYVAQILAVIALAKNSTFMIITKRATRMARLLCAPGFWAHVKEAAALYRANLKDDSTLSSPAEISTIAANHIIPNLTLAVTIESNLFVDRADALRVTPAARRMIAAEPLLTGLPSLVFAGFDAISVGGESGGPPARALVERCPDPGHVRSGHWIDARCGGTGWAPKETALAWVRDIRDRAQAAGIEFSLHQWGGPYGGAGGTTLDGRTY